MLIINSKIAERSYKYNNYKPGAKYHPNSYLGKRDWKHKRGDGVIETIEVPHYKSNNYIEFKFFNREDFNKVPDTCETLLRFEEGWKTASMYKNIKIIERFNRSMIIVLQFEEMLGSQYNYNDVIIEYRKNKIDKIIE